MGIAYIFSHVRLMENDNLQEDCGQYRINAEIVNVGTLCLRFPLPWLQTETQPRGQ
jgi:hypothetical protein